MSDGSNVSSGEKQVSRRPDALIVIAIYHFLIALPSVMGSLMILFFAVIPVMTRQGHVFAQVLLLLLFLFLLAWGVMAAVAGWGLLSLKGWARWIAIVMAMLSIPSFPTGQ